MILRRIQGMSLAVALALGACAAPAGTTGFLSDYSGISTSKNPDGAYEFYDNKTDFSNYKKLMVDRIKIWFKDDSTYKGIDPDELKMLTDYFYGAIEKAVGDSYPLVEEPGPDVMRLRIAASGRRPIPAPILSTTCLTLLVSVTTQVSAGCDRMYFSENCAQVSQSNSLAHPGNSLPATTLK